MDKILKSYQINNKNRELEIRFTNIRSEQWIKYYNTVSLKLPVTRHDIVSVSTDDCRKNSYYGTTKRIEFIRKKTVMRERIDSRCDLVLSIEDPISMMSFKSDAHVRIKRRYSFAYEKKWRIDATLVIEPANTVDIVKKITEYFAATDPIPALISRWNTKCELEIEYVGYGIVLQSADIYDMIAFVTGDECKYSPLIDELLSNPARPQPLSVSLYDAVYANRSQYYLSAKIDGLFALCNVSSDGIICIYFETGSKIIDSIKKGPIMQYVFQVEYVSDKDMYIIDVFVRDNIDIRSSVFIDRYRYATEISQWNSRFKHKEQYHMAPESESFPKCVNLILSKSVQDGIIFNLNVEYNKALIYKFKPADKLTIDLLIISPPNAKQGEYHLYCKARPTNLYTYRLDKLDYYDTVFTDTTSVTSDGFVLIQFQPFIYRSAFIFNINEYKLHNKVGEFLWIPAKRSWKMIQVRDTARINSFTVANMLFTQQYDPLTVDYILDPVQTGYFRHGKDKRYVEQTKYVSHVRQKLYDGLRGRASVLIMAAGKGQEIFIANQQHFRTIIYCDNDIRALSELISRLSSLHKSTYYPGGIVPSTYASNHVVKLNLQDDYKSIIRDLSESTGQSTVDACVIILAIHYIVTSDQQLKNFINLIDNLLNPGGVFYCMGFNGEDIVQLLIEHNGNFKIIDNSAPSSENIIFNIVAKYDVKKPIKRPLWNNIISVKLPFTDEYYDEPLIDVNELCNAFWSMGYETRMGGPILNFLSTYNRRKLLQDSDKKYLSLFTYLAFCKPTSPTAAS